MNKFRTYISHGIVLAIVLVLHILFPQGAKAQYTTDSTFLADAHSIIFPVNIMKLPAEAAQWINDTLMSELNALGPGSIILGRSAASPEGPLRWNHILAQGRRRALTDYITRLGFDVNRIRFDVIDEEYGLLVEMMRQRQDPDLQRVSDIVTSCGDNIVRTKALLKAVDEGRLWKRLLDEYFPQLRATRIMAYDFKPWARLLDLSSSAFDYDPRALMPSVVPALTPHPKATSRYRRELLSIRTNLLEWGAYVPQYGWCPMPNIGLAYYPRHGHWTFGASLDFPWWIGNTTNHKYFELNNYQFEARYYLRNSDKSYSDAQHTLPNGEAAFQGWYLQGNVHAFLYQIGFSAKKGWIGEGLGAGVGAGYMMPVSRDGHWRLDFGLQFGFFRTQYDPFVYGKPIYHGGEIDGLYYYNTHLYRNEFVKRQYRYSWLGPTRIGITLSYDLLYRRKSGKRPSFKKWEEGGEP